MRTRTIAVVAVAALIYYFAILHHGGPTGLPDLNAIVLNLREPPYRFTLSTDPEPPNSGTPITLKVHAMDAASHSADGLSVEAEVSMGGATRGAKHVTFRGVGNGNYRGVVDLDMAGSWDVYLTGTKGGEKGHDKISIDVATPPPPPSSGDGDDDSQS
jgi:YtkA-like